MSLPDMPSAGTGMFFCPSLCPEEGNRPAEAGFYQIFFEFYMDLRKQPDLTGSGP